MTNMGKIDRSEKNLFDMPKGAYVRNKRYVYINTNNKYVPRSERKDTSRRGYTDHDSVCIGVIKDPSRPGIKKFYANNTYLTMHSLIELPEPPKFSDSISVGLNSWVSKASEASDLTSELADVFGEEDTQLILDLSSYMMSKESAVMQHFPAWAREHALFSDDIRDDTFIGKFLRDDLTISKINLFRENWAVKNIGDGRIFLCYDSTNTNSQAEGVFIVQKGHAKDDSTLCQVNTDYVIRQSDGLPLTYLHSPGSVTDIAQAPEMIKFIKRIKDLSQKDVSLCLICDRGYISENNLKRLDEAGIGYMLMLRTNMSLYEKLAQSVVNKIKSYKNEITANCDERYGLTKECCLYEDGPLCYAQIIWSAEKYRSKREFVKASIARERAYLEQFINENYGKSIDKEKLDWVPSYFKLKTEPGESVFVEKRKQGRYPSTKTVEIQTVKILGYEDDENAINNEYLKAAIMITVTSIPMTAQEANDAYAKRDCVEKTFRALKSHLGMDKIGVTTEEAMHGKGLIWFTASILHAILFNNTKVLRKTDNKSYTVPAMIDLLEAIKADKNLSTNKRQRRYQLTKKQKAILSIWDIDENQVDEAIYSLNE